MGSNVVNINLMTKMDQQTIHGIAIECVNKDKPVQVLPTVNIYRYSSLLLLSLKPMLCVPLSPLCLPQCRDKDKYKF